MSGKKRSRDGVEEEGPNGKDHMACDQCRIKKIRCGKERPQCSNCSRLAMYCEWSGHGKKPNQTVLLHQSIATIDSRLERIEGRVSGMYQMLQHLGPHSAAAATKPPYGGGGGSMPETDSGYGYVSGMTSSNFPGTSPTGTPPPPVVHHIAHGPRGYERYFGPTSLMSLLHNFDDLPLLQIGGSSSSSSSSSQANVTMAVTTTAAPDPIVAAATAAAARGAPSPLADAAERVRRLASVYREQQAARDISKMDGKVMVKEPSMLILMALVDPYFQLCNPHLPIWTRAGFRKLLEAAQENAGAAHSTSLTFAMCANNLVLLTLIAMALHGQASSGSSRRSNGTIDVEVIQSYIENASRAIFHVGQLLEPRLVNVQALLSLCAVAQVCLSEEVFSLALTLANQVAKSMGLHQSQGWSSNMSPEESEERRNVLYCLYCLDKAVSWNHGCAPSVGSTAGLLAGLTGSQPGPSEQAGNGDVVNGTLYMSARFALAQIDDNLYASLYGPDAAAATQGFEGQFSKINLEGFEARLGHWRKLYEFDSDAAGGSHISSAEGESGGGGRLSRASRLDLEVSCNLTRMQLLSRFVDDPDVCSALLDDARGCLVSLERLWAATSDPGHCSSFARLVSSFPPMVICRLAFQAATSEGPVSSRDVELLGFLSKSLQTMASMFAAADSYTSKLSAFVDIMQCFVQDSHQQDREQQQQQHQRHQSVSSRHQQYSPAAGQQQQQHDQKVSTTHQSNTSVRGSRMAYDGSSSSSKRHSPEAYEPLQGNSNDTVAAAFTGPVPEHVVDTNSVNIDVEKGLVAGLGLFTSGSDDEVHENYVNGGDLETLMEYWSHQQKVSGSMVFGESDSPEIEAEHNTWQ